MPAARLPRPYFLRGAVHTTPSVGKLTRLFGCLGPPLSSSHSPSCFVGILIVRFLVDLKARGRGEWCSVPSARERASALARGSRRRPLVHAQFGARQNVNQTRKMGVLPAQKCSGDALRAYLSGRDVGWYGCTSSARSAIHPPPWSHPVAQPGAPDVYTRPGRAARLRPSPPPYLNSLLEPYRYTECFLRNTPVRLYVSRSRVTRT